MALRYKVEYNNTAEIGSKIIKFKPWNTKNEKDFLIAVEAQETITEDMLYNMLIKPCLEDPLIKLNANERKMLIIEIRKKSIGTTFPMRYTCSKCKQVNDIDVSLDSIVKFSEDKFVDFVIEDLVFAFYGDISESLLKKLKDEENSIERSFTDFLSHIKAIEVDGVLEDTFSFEELKTFIEELPTYIFDKAFEAFRNMKGKIEFDLKTHCMFCNTENKIDFDHIPNFLWP